MAKVRLTESELHNMIAEAVAQCINEDMENEGWFDGLVGAAKQKAGDYFRTGKSKVAKAGIGTKNWRDKQGTRGKNGQWYQKGKVNGESNPSFSQSFRNHDIAGDIQKAINLIDKNSDYLAQFGIDSSSYQEVVDTLQSFINMVKQGGNRAQRDEKGHFAGIGDQNITPREPIRRTRPSSVKPGSSIMNVD